MDEKEVCNSGWILSEEKTDGLYPMYFGVSCALFALRILSRPEKEDEKWSDLCDKMLQGSAQLLGLLVWRVQKGGTTSQGKCELLPKLQTAEREIEELKKRRHEDAKANEKVVGIFASQEQSWLNERKGLRQHIGDLMHELRVLEKKNDEVILGMNEKLKEMEALVQSKDKVLEEEEKKRKDLEEKLAKAEKVAEELKDTVKHEAQEHSTEIWKHKTAFVELVSNQRQLEAELGRVHRQAEATKQELDLVLEQKAESVLLTQKLSVEVVKMRKEMEQKDKILSAMLRKSKLDTVEKQMLLKEVKLSKAKRKQAELETERWKAVSDSKHGRHSLRSMFNEANLRLDYPSGARGTSHVAQTRQKPADYVLEYENAEFRKDPEIFSPLTDRYLPEVNEELAITSDVKRLEGWVHTEAEKYATLIEKRHHLEIDAFAEQLRVKDEKLEAFHWRFLSMELESKRLQSLVEGLNEDMSRVRLENMKLEALLLEKEEELNFLKEQLASTLKSQNYQKANSKSSPHVPPLANDANWSKVKITKKKTTEKDQETKTGLVEISQEKDTEKEGQIPSNDQSESVSLIAQSPEKEYEELDITNRAPIKEGSSSPLEVGTVEKLALPSQPSTKTNNPPGRMDIHALGVSYKIKRLKQQLLMLEKLTGKQESEEDAESNDNGQLGIKGFLLLISLLNKQVNRYQSLQGKTDDLCMRMHNNDLAMGQGDSSTARRKGETKTLEHFLEETFQLQRYMVATGQKLMEIQSKIASEFLDLAKELEKSANFDMKRFADSIKTLFQEVQRGLEVRIARMIGDLEGTLACEGMIHMRR